ncbi:MAG: hypothetical protein Fur0041_23010 [Bacteroidia bacterium]
MKKLLYILLFLPCLIQAQVDSCGIGSGPVHRYYAQFGLNPDSATSPLLYFNVYEWIGTRYRYAGQTKSGIDCSGFVCKMYKTTYSVSLAGGSKDLFQYVDTVSRNEIREGDILFFKIRNGQISHVGIYLGNNKFAHASVHSGVVISDLDEAYYKKYFYRAGRLKKSVVAK